MNTPQTKNGGPAFPRQPNEYISGRDGMTLRDYFAGQALNGYLASWNDDSDSNSNFSIPYYVAKTSYAYADAMLEAREATK
jgi:hypothetical protein